MARCQCTFLMPENKSFLREAIGQLPGLTGLRALEAIQMEDSLRGFWVNLSESNVVVARLEGLSGPLSLSGPFGRCDTSGVEPVLVVLK